MFITIFILDYLDKDAGWEDSGYPIGNLIRDIKNSEKLILTYDGSTKQVILHNPTTKASYKNDY
jgi:hypothetical protein